MQSYSNRPAWLQPWPRKPWKLEAAMEAIIKKTLLEQVKNTRENIKQIWLSEVLIFFQWSLLLFEWNHMVSESIRSYNSLPANASGRLGLTAETCWEVTISARHEKPLKRFWGCLRFLHDMQRIPWVIPSDFNHKTFFQSKTLSFWILKVLTDTFEEHKNTGVCHWCGFRVKPYGF